MIFGSTRRGVVAAGALALAFALAPTGAALAQHESVLRFSAFFSDQDIRARMMEGLADAVADDAGLQLH